MVKEWFQMINELAQSHDFTVNLTSYPATGINNAPIPQDILPLIRQSTLVIAMTEYSASSTLATICRKDGSSTRCASMPKVERRMEDTAFQADYGQVKRYALQLESILNRSHHADIVFSTGDKLTIDLRNRTALADTGECKYPGQMINFPSGEACKAPYEGDAVEAQEFGVSRTAGILPVQYGRDLIRYRIDHNKIIDVQGNGDTGNSMKAFFSEKPSRRNIAELGIGCNTKAVVTGNVLEDEKVPGIHIAYGMSAHIGGTVISDVHQDICYPKGAPIEASQVALSEKSGHMIELIKNGQLDFDLIE